MGVKHTGQETFQDWVMVYLQPIGRLGIDAFSAWKAGRAAGLKDAAALCEAFCRDYRGLAEVGDGLEDLAAAILAL